MKHKHHIIPRHAGGTDDPSNIIELTIEEHAEAHRILYEQYGRSEDLCAWKGLSGQWSKLQIINYLRTGIPHTEETKQKISKAKKGVSLSEDHKKKISESLKGKKNSDNQKKKAAEKLAMNWLVTDPDGNTFVVNNLRKFARENGVCQGNLTRVARGLLKQCNGYVVSYYNK